jgi:transposase
MHGQGAQAHGFSTDRWTTGKLAEAIERVFGIRYDQDHVGRLMHKLGLRERRFTYTPATVYVMDTPAVQHLAEAV